jgi:murein DD-endopeptidase MepM/ murein hydrolase activator NlpD
VFALLGVFMTGLSAAPSAEARAAGVRPSSGFGWPLRPVPEVSRGFQPPSRPYGPGHRGADLTGRVGQPVLAAGDGVVLYAGPLADRGVVSVRHPNGLRTTYEPVDPVVRPGQLVRRGAPVGTLRSGHSGCPVAACLHWGLLRDQRYLDPLLLVRATAVRLLPWREDPPASVSWPGSRSRPAGRTRCAAVPPRGCAADSPGTR